MPPVPIPVPDLGQALFGALSAAVVNAVTQGVGIYQQMVQSLAGHDVIFSTAEIFADQQPIVMQLWQMNVMVADSALVLVLVWIGYQALLGFYRPLELLSRVVLAVVASHASLQLMGLLVQLNNALSLSVLGFSPHPRPGDVLGTLGFNLGGQALLQLLILLIMASVVVLQMLVRLGLLDVLIPLAPLAMLLYISPTTQRWAHLWAGAFVSALFVQFIQVSAMTLGAALIASFGQGSFIGLLAGVAILTLVLKIPRWLGNAVTSSLGEARSPWSYVGAYVGRLVSSVTEGAKDLARLALALRP